ncbi:MAG: site-specific integrase [Planctomycetaceae bacterium]
MAKRAKGEGGIHQRDDGRWVGRLSLGKDSSGIRQRKAVYGKTQAEVVSKLDALRQQAKTNKKSLLARDTLGAYLQRWLDNDVQLNKAGKTHQEYEIALRLYVLPYLGAEKLSSVDGEMLVEWQAKLSRKGFSPNMRHRSIKVLRAALSKAVKLRLMPYNPCSSLDKPKLTRKEVSPLEIDQCQRLIEKAQGHRLGDVIVLAAMTGLRKGELFALDWSAVNLSEGVLVVRRTLQELNGLTLKEPKTSAAKRVVTLGREAIEALRSRLRKAIDEGFDPDQVPIVFPDTRGGYLRGSNFDRKVWYPIRAAAGIPDTFKFHDLRHTQASLMLAAGVDLKVIQKRLGHQDFATTANTYSHLLQNAQIEAVAKMDAMLSVSMVKAE